MAEIRIGRIVEFLTDVKSEVALDCKRVGGCGYITAMHYFDRAVQMLLEQQTKIEDLEDRLSIAMEENNEYKAKYGELEEDG